MLAVVASPVQEAYCESQSVALCMQILEPAAQCTKEAEQNGAHDVLLDVCGACHSFCRNARLSDLEATLGADKLLHFLAALTQLTLECIQRGGVSVHAATEWQGQATSVLSCLPTCRGCRCGSALGRNQEEKHWNSDCRVVQFFLRALLISSCAGVHSRWLCLLMTLSTAVRIVPLHGQLLCNNGATGWGVSRGDEALHPCLQAISLRSGSRS
jgi:hypothetical protein